MMELTPVVWLQARMTQARTNGSTYLRLNSDSEDCGPAALFTFSVAAVSSISFNSVSACSSVRERRSAASAASFLPLRNSQRGDSATMKLPMTNKMPGGRETQKMLRQAVSLNANNLSASPSLATASTRLLKYNPMTAAATMPKVSSH